MVAAVVARMTLAASRRYRDVVLAVIALVQCYATRTSDGCAPLSYHDTMVECRVLAEDYRRFDSKALARAGIPAVVSYRPTDDHHGRSAKEVEPETIFWVRPGSE